VRTDWVQAGLSAWSAIVASRTEAPRIVALLIADPRITGRIGTRSTDSTDPKTRHRPEKVGDLNGRATWISTIALPIAG
jgi:hypothetical protein